MASVNKFIGDGILAIFSDEDEGATPGDHPLRAVPLRHRNRHRAQPV